jgi:hypothetical protein
MRWLFVLLAAVTLTVVVACGGGDDSANPSGTSQVSGGGLTAEAVDKLKQIVGADPTVAEIAGNQPYKLEELGPWSAGAVPESGQEIFIGAIATMVLSQPVKHVERDLPVATIRTYYPSWSPEDRAKYAPYRQGTARFAVDNLSRLHLSVDLDRGKVVGIKIQTEQDVNQRVAAVPVQPTPQSTSGMSQAATTIINSDPTLSAIIAGRTNQSGAGSTYTIANAHFAADAYTFDSPQSIEADWHVLFEFDQATGLYQAQTIHFSAADVATVSVVIDLDKGAIAWLEPVRQKAGPTATP